MGVKNLMKQLGKVRKDMDICPRCKKRKLFKGVQIQVNSVAKDASGFICADCGILDSVERLAL